MIGGVQFDKIYTIQFLNVNTENKVYHTTLKLYTQVTISSYLARCVARVTTVYSFSSKCTKKTVLLALSFSFEYKLYI